MKVDVIQVAQATFKPFFFWSDWIDVSMYDYDGSPYLLQMKVNRFNKKKFRNVKLTGIWLRLTTCAVIGDLTQMSKETK